MIISYPRSVQKAKEVLLILMLEKIILPDPWVMETTPIKETEIKAEGLFSEVTKRRKITFKSKYYEVKVKLEGARYGEEPPDGKHAIWYMTQAKIVNRMPPRPQKKTRTINPHQFAKIMARSYGFGEWRKRYGFE